MQKLEFTLALHKRVQQVHKVIGLNIHANYKSLAIDKRAESSKHFFKIRPGVPIVDDVFVVLLH